MGFHTKISTKGQVVLPKAVRDRLNWTPGLDLEVVEHAGGLTLRAAPARPEVRTTEEILARIRTLNTYHGPRITDEDIRGAVETAIRSKWPDRDR